MNVFGVVAGSAMPLLYASSALAQGPASQGMPIPIPPPEPTMTQMLAQMSPMFLMVMVIYYLLVLRPKATEERAHKSLIDTLSKGDTVLTSGGIIGKVVSSKDGVVHLELAKTVQVRIDAEHVTRRYEEEGTVKSAA